MTNLDRRALLQSLAAFGAVTLAGRAWAAPQTNAKLLVVFLRGAYDAANVIIPTGSEFYYSARPNLAIARPGSRPDQPKLEALALDADWSLHPAFHDSLLPLWQKREIAFIPFAGTDDLTRSHFETQDTIELGQSIHATRDTHVNQGGATGYLADRLGELGRGLVAFSDELGPQDWHDTLVVVISEFGRTFRENGDKGTDHGHGSTYWVLGGSVNGGRIHGPQVKVEEASLFQNCDFQVLTDYRSLFGGLLGKMYGLNSSALNTIFPTAKPVDLALV